MSVRLPGFIPVLVSLCLFVRLGMAEGTRDARPIADLPKEVKAQPGRIGLYFDTRGWLTDPGYVYLVNRSADQIVIQAQDGDPYLKLEYEKSPGVWVRAQTHSFSWCGNSYFSGPPLQPGEFVTLKPYRPSVGRQARLRYALYGQSFKVATDPFIGLVDDSEIEHASVDALAISLASLDEIQDIATGARKIENKLDHTNPQSSAIARVGELARSDPRARALLAEIAARGTDYLSRHGMTPQGEASVILRQLEPSGPEESPN